MMLPAVYVGGAVELELNPVAGAGTIHPALQSLDDPGNRLRLVAARLEIRDEAKGLALCHGA
jgi:hypothetical protein